MAGQNGNPRGTRRAFLFGSFLIGMVVLPPAGILIKFASDFAITPVRAGMVMLEGGLVVEIGALLSAALTSRLDRGRILAASLRLHADGHAALALVRSFGALLALRAVAVVAGGDRRAAGAARRPCRRCRHHLHQAGRSPLSLAFHSGPRSPRCWTGVRSMRASGGSPHSEQLLSGHCPRRDARPPTRQICLAHGAHLSGAASRPFRPCPQNVGAVYPGQRPRNHFWQRATAPRPR